MPGCGRIPAYAGMTVRRAADFPFIRRAAGFPLVLQQVQDERKTHLPADKTSIAPFPPLCYNKSAGKNDAGKTYPIQAGSLAVTASSAPYRKRVYTKFGDKGETSLLYGGRVSKNDPHTEAYGITDEAVSVMGLARSLSPEPRVRDILRDAQRELFTIAAELATEPDKYELFQQHFAPVTAAMVTNLEQTIDALEEEFSNADGLCAARRLAGLGGH